MISYPRMSSPLPGGTLATAANALSLFRILVLPLLVALILRAGGEASFAATAVFIVAAFTDLLDGLLARGTGTVTELGKVLDPLADRILIGGTIIALAAVGALPVAGVLLVLLRDIFLLSGYKLLQTRGVILRVSLPGKAYTALFLIAIVAVLADVSAGGVSIGLVLFWVSVIGSILTGIGYTMRGMLMLKAKKALSERETERG